jgi:hypothetical protein
MSFRAFQRLAVAAACAVALAFPATSSAGSFFAGAAFGGLRPTVAVGSPARAIVFGFGPVQFLTIDEVCFHFSFADDIYNTPDDPLDPGDELTITPLNAQPSMSGPGFGNSTATPQYARTLCIPNDGAHGPFPSLFLDGFESNIEIAMGHGSVTLYSLVVEVRGTALVALEPLHITLTFRGDAGRTVTWGGDVDVFGEVFEAPARADGTVLGLQGTGQLNGSPPVALSADLQYKGIGQVVTGSLTATRGNQRITARNIVGKGAPLGIDLFSRVQYYDGRNTSFGDLSIRIADTADG